MTERAEEQRFETLAVHAGADPDPSTGAVVPAIQPATTFKQDAVGSPRQGFEYARSDNPTRRALEATMAALEGGDHGLAFASGLAATQNLLYLLDPGDRLVMTDDAYGGTWRLARQVMARYGIESQAVDLRDLDAVRRALAGGSAKPGGGSWPPARMLWIETPTNPLLKVADIRALSGAAASVGAMTVVDNTFATPFLQRPLELGADVVLHSATKYLGGHSDVVGGVLVTSSASLAERLRFTQNAAGAVPSPFDCWLLMRGIRTLALRMERACSSAASIAEWLAAQPQVEHVHYPGLAQGAQRELALRQMRLPGAIVSFQIRGGEAAAHRFAASTRLFTLAESLGAVESLVEVPAAMTHLSVSDTPMAVPANLIRLSVGVEHVDDLLADLAVALSAGVPTG
jgi:cystathionine gamma-synthase